MDSLFRAPPSPPPHFPDFRSTPSPLRRRLPRPLPEIPYRRPTSPASSSSSSSPRRDDAPETIRAIIREIDVALEFTNARGADDHFSTSTAAVPRAISAVPPSPTRSISSVSTTSTSSSSSSSSSSSLSSSSHSRTLRRKYSPSRGSLRELRERDSEMCLQRVYERQLMAYLDGTIFRPP